MHILYILIILIVTIACWGTIHHYTNKQSTIASNSVLTPNQQTPVTNNIQEGLYYTSLPITLNNTKVTILLETKSHQEHTKLSDEAVLLAKKIEELATKEKLSITDLYTLREKLLTLTNTEVYPVAINNIFIKKL